MDQVPITLVAAVVTPLVTAVIVLWKKNNDTQDKRLNDLKEIGDKTNATIAALTDMTKKIYDALPERKRDK